MQPPYCGRAVTSVKLPGTFCSRAYRVLVRQPTPRSLADEWSLSDRQQNAMRALFACNNLCAAAKFHWPFWLKPFFAQGDHCFRVDRQCSVCSRKVFVVLIASFLHSCQPSHGTQGMELCKDVSALMGHLQRGMIFCRPCLVGTRSSRFSWTVFHFIR